LKKGGRHFASMVCVGEDISDPGNRITLSDNLDEYGVPLAHTVHNMSEKSETMLKNAVEQGKKIMTAAGASDSWATAPFGMHHMGGTVMGKNAETSVADSFGRVHGLENLYVAGSGLFPSSGAVNPTFTIHALALRSIESILAAG